MPRDAYEGNVSRSFIVPPASAGERWCRKAPKGGKRPKAANHRNAIFAYESKIIKPESAGSWQLEANCFRLYMQRLLPADRYLSAFPHLQFLLRAFCIECASRPKLALSLPIRGLSFWLADRPFFTSFRMTGPAGRLSRNADYKLRRQPPPQPSAAQGRCQTLEP